MLHQTSEVKRLTSDIIHITYQTSDIRNLTSHVWPRTSDVWHQKCDIRHLKSDVWYQTPDIWNKTCEIRRLRSESDNKSMLSDIWYQTSHISHIKRLPSDNRHLKCDMYDHWCQTSDLMTYNRHLTSDVSCLMSYVIRRLMSDIWCQTFDLRRLMFYVSCETSDMWYMYDVRCQTFDVWYKYVWCVIYNTHMTDIWCIMSYVKCYMS